MKTVYLSYEKAVDKKAVVDLEKYYEKYGIKGSRHKMMVGSPLVLNIEGTYVYVDSISDIMDNVPKCVSDYIRSLKCLNEDIEYVRFKWVK